MVDWYFPGPGWEQLYYNTTGLCRSFKGAFLGGGENLRTDDPDYNLGRSYWTPFGYLGMRRDRFTGLYHTHFREYDAIHGRWLSEDPAGYADGLNLYQAYMGVNGTDPLGLNQSQPWEWNHLFAQNVFDKGKKDSVINQCEWVELADDVDINSSSNGLLMLCEDHDELHRQRYNNWWEDWVRNLEEEGKGAGKKIVINRHMLKARLQEAKQQFSILERGLSAKHSYSNWKALSSNQKWMKVNTRLNQIIKSEEAGLSKSMSELLTRNLTISIGRNKSLLKRSGELRIKLRWNNIKSKGSKALKVVGVAALIYTTCSDVQEVTADGEVDMNEIADKGSYYIPYVGPIRAIDEITGLKEEREAAVAAWENAMEQRSVVSKIDEQLMCADPTRWLELRNKRLDILRNNRKRYNHSDPRNE